MKRKPISLLSGAQIEIPQDRYLADMELHDRYQQFSAELLRLSLAGLAALGIIVGLLGDSKTAPAILETLESASFSLSSKAGAFALVGAAAFALLHRFFASDGMFHHLRAIKLLILAESRQAASDQEQASKMCEIKRIRETARADEDRRNKRFKYAGTFLGISATLMTMAGVLLCVALVQLLPG